MALPRAGHWGANCHLEGQKSNHSFFITYCFPSLPRPVFTLFLPPVVGSPDILWLLWFNCTLKLSAGISSCSFRKINSVSRDQIPWRSKSWTCSGALINFKLVWACSVLGVHRTRRRRRRRRRRLWLDYGCVFSFDSAISLYKPVRFRVMELWENEHQLLHILNSFTMLIKAVFSRLPALKRPCLLSSSNTALVKVTAVATVRLQSTVKAVVLVRLCVTLVKVGRLSGKQWVEVYFKFRK